MKKILLLSMFATAIFMSSCSKNDKKEATPSMKQDYAPFNVGSSFTYNYITKDFFSDGYDTTTAVMKISGTENYEGKTWLTGNNAPIGNTIGENALIKVDDKAFTVLIKSFDPGNGETIKDMSLDFLQFPLATGKSWESQHFTYNLEDVIYESYYKYKVLSTAAQLTVNGKAYTNLVEMKEDYYYGTAAQDAILLATTYRYYDKKAGLVNSVITQADFLTGEISDTTLVQNLVSYEIQ